MFRSPKTALDYSYDWKGYAAWCTLMGRKPCPATWETAALYLTSMLLRGCKVNTVRRVSCAIADAHKRADVPSPITHQVRELLSGASRERAEGLRQMTPITVAQVRSIAKILKAEGTAVAIRNRAIVTLGFASALRRSNIVAMQLSDLSFVRQGLIVRIRREKQDPESRGRTIGIPKGAYAISCPVRSIEAWLEHRGRRPGPLFVRLDNNRSSPVDPLSGWAVLKIAKDAVAKAGLDPRLYGPHSFRAGLITEAGLAGVEHLIIAKHTGHRSLESLVRYFRPAEMFRRNPAALIGL